MTSPLERVARLRTEHAKATPAPWRLNHECPDGRHHHDFDHIWLDSDGAKVAYLGERYTCAPPDAALIVRLRNAAEAQLDLLAWVLDPAWCDRGSAEYSAALSVLDQLDPGGDQ